MTQSTSNKLYLSLTAASLVFTILINFCTKISSCALIFTFLALTLNAISALQDNKKAMRTIIFCTIISFTLLWNLKYYVYGERVNGLVLASLLSVLVSSYAGLNAFSKLKLMYNFYVGSFISLLIYAVVDGIVMSLFFINIFPMNKVFTLFYSELAYKSIYSVVACLCLFIVSHLLKQGKISHFSRYNS